MKSIITKKACHFPCSVVNFTRMASRAEPVAVELNLDLNGRSQSPSHQCEEKDDVSIQSKSTSQYGEDTEATISVKNRREKKKV